MYAKDQKRPWFYKQPLTCFSIKVMKQPVFEWSVKGSSRGTHPLSLFWFKKACFCFNRWLGFKVSRPIQRNDWGPCLKSRRQALWVFKFSVHYTRTYPDETKFYLRFKLFPPKDLKETIQKHMYETNEAKKNFYMNHLIACKDPHFSKESVYQRYVNFIDTCTFNLIFSNWQPSEAELHRSWVLFFNNQIRQSPERGV